MGFPSVSVKLGKHLWDTHYVSGTVLGLGHQR